MEFIKLLFLCNNFFIVFSYWTGEIVFEDNFNGSSLDLNKWNYQEGCSDLYGGRTLNCYKAGTGNVKVSDGKLLITAKIQANDGRDYTSGRIIQKTGFQYGAYVVRAKMPKGKHLWPALWLFSNDNTCRYEEIDIAEFRGQEPRVLEQAAHFGNRWDSLKSAGEAIKTVDLSADFHEFAVLWTPSKLEWYVDNVKTYGLSLTDGLPNPPWRNNGFKEPCGSGGPFSDPEKFIFNIAVGGSFFDGGHWGPDLTIDEARNWEYPTLEIDWVRIYQE